MKSQKVKISKQVNEWLSLLRQVEMDYAKEEVLIAPFNLLSNKDKVFVRTYQDNLLNSTIILENIDTNKQDLLKVLINLDFDIDTPNIRGLSPLSKAIQYNLNDIIPLLINKVIDINQARLDVNGRKFGSSALMIACEQGNLNVVKLLVEKGADINYQNEFKFMAINYTIDKNYDDRFSCFSYLISCLDIDLKSLNRFHEDILSYILRYGNQKYIEVLSDNHLFLTNGIKNINEKNFYKTNTTNNVETQKELFQYYLKREQMFELENLLCLKEKKKSFKI